MEYSQIMLAAMSQTDKDAIRHLSFDERLPIYGCVEDRLRALFGTEDGNLSLLSTHLTILLGQRINVFPLSHYQAYGMAAVVVLEAPPNVVIARREADASRIRHLETEALVQAQQAENLRVAAWVSDALHVPLLRVDNSAGTDYVDVVARWLQTLASSSTRIRTARLSDI